MSAAGTHVRIAKRALPEKALRPRLEHHVEQSLGGAPESRESSRMDHFAKPGLTRLCAQSQPDLLREGSGMQITADAEEPVRFVRGNMFELTCLRDLLCLR
jgi:hypothetical protein